MASQKQNLDSQKPLQEARVIESLESVPQVYQEFFQTHLPEAEAFPYTVLTPANGAPSDAVSGKLLCIIEHTFYVLEQEGSGLKKICYPIDEINSVEVVHRPLDLQVKVNGVTNLGTLSVTVFGCSRVTSQVFAPLFQRIRLRIDALNERAPSRHMERLDRWSDLDTQVIDMARHCLMPGETVIESILQPEIRAGLFSLDRASRGAKCPTHICILTDKELVMIREEPSLGNKDFCGGICNFVPLSKIHTLTRTRENGNLQSISIRLLNGEVFESLFDVSLENEVKRFLEMTRELMPKEKLYVRD